VVRIFGLHAGTNNYYRRETMPSEKPMATSEEDEETRLMEAAFERCAAPHPRDLLKREYDEYLKGRPRDIALKKWGPQLEAQIWRDLGTTKLQASILPFAKPEPEKKD
jgi:hypothetical protein